MRRHFKPLAFGFTLCFLSTGGFSSPNFQAPPSTTNFQPITTTPTTSNNSVMSASDFAAKVQRMQQETKDRLAKQVQDSLPKPQPSPTRPSTMTTSSQPVAPTTTTSAPQTQTYTGFGTTSTPKTTVKPATPATGGGLKIQY